MPPGPSKRKGSNDVTSTLKPSRQAAPARIIRHTNPFQQAHVHTTYSLPVSGSGPRASQTRILVSSHPPAAKRPKVSFPLTDTYNEPPVDPTPLKEPPKKLRPQGASVLMGQFEDAIPTILSAILGGESLPKGPNSCDCGESEPRFRCRDCFQPPVVCAACLVRTHIHAPFHSIAKWNGTFFETTPLHALGLVVALGHCGEVCPNVPTGHSPRTFTIVHTNGLHRLSIHFCHCVGRLPTVEQLLGARLFPSTLTQPESAMTFGVLKNAHLHTLCSKKSIYDYYGALRRLTNNVFPGQVPDRYREFLRAIRVWKLIAMIKRSGQAHGIDRLLSHRPAGTLSVWCPTCPEDKFNMPPNWTTIPEHLRHIHTWQISTDGQFSLQKKKKVDDPDDVALASGHAYFVDNEPFQNYLRGIQESQEKSTCNNLSVVNTQNSAKFKNAEITGVVAFVCARHGMFLANGMVDLQKGERYANVDYALAHVLHGRASLPWIQMTYDIWCQYHIHLVRRFEAHFPDEVSTVGRITGCVPKLHLVGHAEKCQYQYSLNYTPHSGRTHGEVVESGWAESKLAGPMTREMNAGHRHDTLDDFHGDFNWQKVTKRTPALYASFTNAKAKAAEFAAFFDNLTVDPKLVAEWETYTLEPTVGKGGEIKSVYRPRVSKVLTQARALQALSAEELQHSPGASSCGEVMFLSKGLKIEAMQRRLCTDIQEAANTPSSAQASQLHDAREKLTRDMDEWRREQIRRFPLLEDVTRPCGYDGVETERLHLPSDFTAAERDQFGLQGCTSKERTLREGQANDALVKLRLAIKGTHLSIDFKKKNVRGQKDNTRAQTALRRLSGKKHKYASLYRDARHALINLGMADSDLRFQPLLDTELWMKRLDDAHTLGDGHQREPWFWTTGPMSSSDSERADWDIEAERVQWFRARANRDRWREEVEMVEEEYRRTYRAWTRMANVWRELAQPSMNESRGWHEGKVGYAYKTASMYDCLAAECQRSYLRATGYDIAVAQSGPQGDIEQEGLHSQ